MNDITYAVSVDVNNPAIPYNVYVASVLDSNVRYLEITLYQNGNVITLGNTATATASLVTDDVLIDDSVECTISNNIITVPLEDLQRHGNLDVQVTVTEDTKVLAIPFPIQVRVTPNIAENAQIDENSMGSYAEVVQEIAGARGSYDKLKDRLDHTAAALAGKMDKLSAGAANKIVLTNGNGNVKAGLHSVTGDKNDIENGELYKIPNSKAVQEYASGKADKSDTYTKAQVDEALLLKANTTDIPAVPTKTSDLQNDSGFLTQHQDISGKMDKIDSPVGGSIVVAKSDGHVQCSGYHVSDDARNIIFQDKVLTGYAIKNYVEGKGFLTAQDISGKADKSDVYTQEQIDAMRPLGGTTVASSVENMTDTSKLYVLSSTGHIFMYATVDTDPPNELTVTDYNKYLNSSGVAGAKNGVFIAQEIPVDLTVAACTITFQNFAATMGTQGTDGRYNNSRICALDANKNFLGASYISRSNVNASTSHWQCVASGDDMVGDLVAFGNQMVTLNKASSLSDIKYIHVAPQLSENAISSADTANLGIAISTHGGMSSQWTDTGVVYGGGNEGAITALSARVTAAENNIAELAAGTPAVIPSYWQAEVDDTVSKIKALQDANGHDLLCFGWCSDMHVESGGSDYVKNIGAVASRVMNACDIPLFLVTGDLLTANTGTTLAQIPSAYQKAWEYLSPIGMDKLLVVKGNHDAWTGNNGSGVYYVKGLPPEKLHSLLFRPQEQDLRRVFGGDGSYFYVDNVPQKTRFICLNSQWAAYEENQDGTAKYSTQKAAGFGQAQLDWLTDEALKVDAGYSVIVAMHVPPTAQTATSYHNFFREYTIIRGILTAYGNKTTYSGSYTYQSRQDAYLTEDTWANVSVNCDFSQYNGTLRGVFCGHCHMDQAVTGDLPAPIVCITCATNSPYGGVDPTSRVLGTKDETAFDFVCVNRRTGAINLIRCGYGTDRTITVSNS